MLLKFILFKLFWALFSTKMLLNSKWLIFAKLLVVGDGFEPSKAELTDLQIMAQNIINNNLNMKSNRL